MRKARHCIVVALLAGIAATWAGCGNTQPATRWWDQETSPEVVKPGLFDSKPADGRRFYFDFYNEQVIHANVKVGTVFMGDSITQLWELDAYFKPADGVILNRGISGDLASIMAKRFEADVIQLRPRNVVILAGTNDVARMLEADRSDSEIIQEVTTSVERMILDAREADIHVLVCSILPTNDDNRLHEGKKRILPQINENLEELCTKHGAVWVDYASAMLDEAGDLRKNLADDGLHPHWKGYELMADILRQTATKNLLWL